MTTQLVTAERAAEILAVSLRTLRDLPIKKVRIGKRAIRYRLADVEAYIDRRAARHWQ